MGQTYGLIWVSFDSGLVTITCTHMFYMSYVRFRSLKAPFSYHREFFIKHCHLVMAIIWVIGLSIWIAVAFSFGLFNFTNIINYNPLYSQAIINFFVWVIPLALIILIAFKINFILKKRSRKKSDLKFAKILKSSTIYSSKLHTLSFVSVQKTGSFSRPSLYQTTQQSKSNRITQIGNCLMNLDAQTKFLIIIGTFLIQWLPSSILAILVSLCVDCVSNDAFSAVYWLTYTVCCTDAIVVLLLNSNVIFCRSCRNSSRNL